MSLGIDLILHLDALGEFVVTSAHVVEALSTPTSATVRVEAKEDVDEGSVVGATADLEVIFDGQSSRHFQLVVSAVSFEGMGRLGERIYVVELRHEIDGLRFRSDVRMFQEKDVKTIVSDVLGAAEIDPGHVEFSLRRTLPKREYCIQHRETDLVFVQRLLAHEGIFYFCHDTDSAPKTTFADNTDAFPPIDGETKVRLIDDDGHGPGIRDLIFETRATPEKATVSDYNFTSPATDLTKDAKAVDAPTGDWFEYATGHTTPGEGGELAAIRLGEWIAQRTTIEGGCENPAFRAGAWFELEEVSRATLAGKHLLERVEHTFHVRQTAPGVRPYENRFVCIPEAHGYRPRHKIEAHRGAQSVVVTGPSGEEIHTDVHGRMKAKFFWDRLGKDDDTSSCWMRLVQLPLSGSMALARMGWEMSVLYIDGDPDRPVAVSRLYNAEKTSPYSYPAAKTRMSFQTSSSPASGKSNEIRMEDGAGGQEFFINASKDFAAQTNNNKGEKIGANSDITVGVDSGIAVVGSQTASISGTRSTTVSADAGVNVAASRSKIVGGSESATIGGGSTIVVSGAAAEVTAGTHTTLAAGGIAKTGTGSFSQTVGGSIIDATGDSASLSVLGAKSETVGGVKLAAAGESVTESVIGALACTVGGAIVHGAGGNRTSATTGASAITVGGLYGAVAAGKVSITAPIVSIKVAGTANMIGGGGVLNMTPGSILFEGLVTVDASGSVKVTGNPNLLG